MLLIVITPEKTIKHETEIIDQLFKEGLQRLHLRKPAFSSSEYRKYIEAIDPVYHPRIALHGGFKLLSEFKLGGIHLNSAMRDDREARKNIMHVPASAISGSFHSWMEVEKNYFDYSYVFISPVFDSISKAGYKGNIDLQGAMDIKQKFGRSHRYCPQIIGLGGVGAPQIEILHKYGFDGAAVIGGIWSAKDPVTAFREMNETMIKIMKAG